MVTGNHSSAICARRGARSVSSLSADAVGTGGIEQSYEKELRGVKGTRFTLVDVHNREQGSFNEGKFDTAAVPGNNMISSLDITVRVNRCFRRNVPPADNGVERNCQFLGSVGGFAPPV